MRDKFGHNLPIIVYSEGDKLVAQCVEFDIREEATDLTTLVERMDALIEVKMSEYVKTGIRLPPAPDKAVVAWASAGINNQYRVVTKL